MKPPVYLALFILILPLQSSMLGPLAIAGISPDLVLIAVYVIGLLTGPREAAVAGLTLGFLQDINSAGFVGLMALTHGAAGFSAGLLGRNVLNFASPSNILFLAAFSLGEAVLITLFIQVIFGSVPFFSMLFTRMLPAAVYTGLFGTLVLQLLKSRKTLVLLTRPSLQKEF
ncbi:MAG: rod shape-determining protein MreD [Nitrospirae bacterium GWC2_57_13]|jgi:rod shape-determining protein MreD|nr:MAG: rod shape-determining protein MreD [Nitrospirae bacterium GWC2_57_13]OGW43365.1 MAG: rod shape-determining protein MreD [Nitrospirae bacterium GWD2_57_8]HAS54691.1 rod shape-determining protein MreD [Nitrospiraceae bacterium]